MNDLNREYERYLLDMYSNQVDKAKGKFYEFMKLLLVTSLAIMSGFTAFVRVGFTDLMIHILYCIVLISLGLAIISSVIVIYGEIFVLKRAQEQLRQFINNPSKRKDTPDVIETSLPGFFKFFRVIAIVSYLLFIISIVVFGIYAT